MVLLFLQCQNLVMIFEFLTLTLIFESLPLAPPPSSSQGGCYLKGPICYPALTPSRGPLFGTFIYQERAVNGNQEVSVLSLRGRPRLSTRPRT